MGVVHPYDRAAVDRAERVQPLLAHVHSGTERQFFQPGLHVRDDGVGVEAPNRIEMVQQRLDEREVRHSLVVGQMAGNVGVPVPVAPLGVVRRGERGPRGAVRDAGQHAGLHWITAPIPGSRTTGCGRFARIPWTQSPAAFRWENAWQIVSAFLCWQSPSNLSPRATERCRPVRSL